MKALQFELGHLCYIISQSDFKNYKPDDITADDIIEIVAHYFNIPASVLHAKTRKREIVQARQISMFFAKKLTKMSLTEIGHAIGRKDHATVLHANKTVSNLCDTDKSFKLHVDNIAKMFVE